MVELQRFADDAHATLEFSQLVIAIVFFKVSSVVGTRSARLVHPLPMSM